MRIAWESYRAFNRPRYSSWICIQLFSLLTLFTFCDLFLRLSRNVSVPNIFVTLQSVRLVKERAAILIRAHAHPFPPQIQQRVFSKLILIHTGRMERDELQRRPCSHLERLSLMRNPREIVE